MCNLDAHMERTGEGKIWPAEVAARYVSRLSCQQIIADWPQFEQYLSVSHIKGRLCQVLKNLILC